MEINNITSYVEYDLFGSTSKNKTMFKSSKLLTGYCDSDSDSDSDAESESENEKEECITVLKNSNIKEKRFRTKKGEQSKAKNDAKKTNITEDFDHDDELTLDESLYDINIRVTNRNGRKAITSVEGAPLKFVKSNQFDQFMKHLKSALASRATLQGTDDNPIIEVSGKNVDKIKELLIKYINCREDQIKIHGI